jgi:hypothetical protein
MNTIAKEIQTSKDLEQFKTQLKTTRTTGRAEALADRIEEGAANLAAFAERLSEEEWRTPVSESGRGGRSVGVIVHHVASVYPIKIDLARIIASGKAVTDVTFSVKLNSFRIFPVLVPTTSVTGFSLLHPECFGSSQSHALLSHGDPHI